MHGAVTSEFGLMDGFGNGVWWWWGGGDGGGGGKGEGRGRGGEQMGVCKRHNNIHNMPIVD
jgi:hypothetical protein